MSHPLVYLDYAATTPILPEVVEAMTIASQRFYANASALHTPGHLALNEIEHTRELLAKLINADPSEIIFTSGASEANNTVIHTFAGHQIETSPLEHHSILTPAKLYRGAKTPKLYSYMLANNETGEFLSLPTVDHQTSYLHSDLTQVLGKVPIDVQALGLDYATFSAHKIGGPTGVGALYVKKGAPFKPLIIGGGQEHKRRGGTYNTIGIIGFGAALSKVLDEEPWQIYHTKVRHLRDTLASGILTKIPGSSLNTNITQKDNPTPIHNSSDLNTKITHSSTSSPLPYSALPHILNVSFQAAEGEAIQLYLDAEGIVVSTGSACASGDIEPSHVLMAKTNDAEVAHSSIRFSFGLNSSSEDVKRVMEVLPRIVKRLQQMSTIPLKK